MDTVSFSEIFVILALVVLGLFAFALVVGLIYSLRLKRRYKQEFAEVQRLQMEVELMNMSARKNFEEMAKLTSILEDKECMLTELRSKLLAQEAAASERYEQLLQRSFRHDPGITDLSDSNRTEKVVQQARDLCTRSESTLLDGLEEQLGRQDWCLYQLRTDLFVVTYQSVEERLRKMFERSFHELGLKSSEKTEAAVTELKIVLRSSHGIPASLSDVTKVVLDEVKGRYAEVDLSSESVAQFVAECVRVSWLLLIQTPPLRLDFDLKDQTFRSKRHVLQSECSSGKDAAIRAVCWPGVYSDSPEKPLLKAIVFTAV